MTFFISPKNFFFTDLYCIVYIRPLLAAVKSSPEGTFIFSATFFLISSSDSLRLVKSLERSSVVPMAMARTMFLVASTSTDTSTVSGEAPDFIARSSASRRTARISCWVGFGIVRSTVSRIMANATPIVEITGAFFAFLYFNCSASPRWGTTADAPPPPPTSIVVRASIL